MAKATKETIMSFYAERHSIKQCKRKKMFRNSRTTLETETNKATQKIGKE
jgi:hypothetical protein